MRLPRIVVVRSTDTFKGDDWLGLTMREASVVRSIGVLPVRDGVETKERVRRAVEKAR